MGGSLGLPLFPRFPRLQAPDRHPENGVVQLVRKLQKKRKLENKPKSTRRRSTSNP